MSEPRRVSETTSRATLAAEALEDFGFDVRSAGQESEALLAELARHSERARQTLDHVLDVPYGADADTRLDIYRPARPGPHPVLTFFDGGVPGTCGTRAGAFMAPTMARAGIMTVCVDRARPPSAPLARAVEQCRRALAWVEREIGAHGGDPGRLALCGHSNGAHLAAMACAAEASLKRPPLLALLLSGVFDLAALTNGSAGACRGLAETSVIALSPVHHPPPSATQVVLSCGEYESEAFKRQTDGYFRVCAEAGCRTRYISAPRRSHLDIVLGLADDDHPFMGAIANAIHAAQWIGPN